MTSDAIYPEPPAALTRPGITHRFAMLGPGVIIASVTIGSGELVWASRSGAIFGYALLWCFLYAGVFKAIQVYTAARHITLTGEHPMAGWRTLPGPPLWFPLVVAVPAVMLMPIAFSGIPEMLGGYVHRFAGIQVATSKVGPWEHLEFWINVWTTLVLSLCLGLALLSSYTLLERVSLVVLGLMVACIAGSVFVLGPNALELLAGMFIPRVADFPEVAFRPEYAAEFQGRSPWLEISLYLSAVGGGAYDYIGYVGMVRTKGWGLAGQPALSREQLEAAVAGDSPEARATIRRAKQWARAPLFDTSVSFFFVVLVTLLFGILGTLVLHREGAIPANDDLLNQQERFLTILHPELRWLYRAAVFLALGGTLYGAFEVYRYTFLESLLAIAPRWVTPRSIPYLRGSTTAYCFLGGLAMVWLPVGIAGTIVQRMTFGTMISGAATCGLWCFAMLWLDRVRLPVPLRMSRLLWGLTWIAGAGMTLLGVQTMIAYFN
ncbi:MAG: Nramp family divalent metal transporter [Pirellulales bacterium]|nr:Nramp family divalent metal transporter [Pirellulales bacterium]